MVIADSDFFLAEYEDQKSKTLSSYVGKCTPADTFSSAEQGFILQVKNHPLSLNETADQNFWV